MNKMVDLDLAGKRVLIREDLNVPIDDGVITSTARIDAALPTIRTALDAGASVMIMSHLGRPTEGEFDSRYSLAPVAASLQEKLGIPVELVRDWLDGVGASAERVVLCENVRFNVGEKADDDDLSAKMAALCDVFVMDAFGTAHRAQASTHGVARVAPVACAGPLLVAELEALGRALHRPDQPVVAIVGGSKVSTKLTVLEALADKVDVLIPGGGIANTFLLAADHSVGRSLAEPELVDAARALLNRSDLEVIVPTDVRVGTEFSPDATARVVDLEDEAVSENDLIFDIGPATARRIAKVLETAGTIIWNGPVGVFEFAAFADGTREIGEAIAASPGFSIAGGGDTLAAIDQFDLKTGISYISTGGGAFLEFVEGKTLPAVAVLQERASNQ